VYEGRTVEAALYPYTPLLAATLPIYELLYIFYFSYTYTYCIGVYIERYWGPFPECWNIAYNRMETDGSEVVAEAGFPGRNVPHMW